MLDSLTSGRLSGGAKVAAGFGGRLCAASGCRDICELALDPGDTRSHSRERRSR